MAENKSTSTKLEWGVILGSKSGRVTSGFNAMDSLKNIFSKIKMAVSQPCFELFKFFLALPLPKGTGSYGTGRPNCCLIHAGAGACYFVLCRLAADQLRARERALHGAEPAAEAELRARRQLRKDSIQRCGRFTLKRCGRKGGLGLRTPTFFTV